MTPAQADALVATLPPLAGITADSRRVAQRMAFAAYPGTAHDGRTFIDDALARGASAIVYEARDFAWPARADVAHAAVSNLKTSVGPIASAIYDHPSQALWMVGVTGTNGKSSCAHFVARALAHVGRRTAVVGTLGSSSMAASIRDCDSSTSSSLPAK